MHYLFLEPVDVLFLRANKSFGDPGSYGESMVPPWPSVIAGALRSRMLADSDIDLAEFAADRARHPEIGTPSSPGRFELCAAHLAQRSAQGVVDPLFPLPLDLVAETSGGVTTVLAARPVELPPALRSSYPLPMHPVVAQSKRGKPAAGLWLKRAGWQEYLNGKVPGAGQLVSSSDLWKPDPRTGIGLDAHTRSVEEGRLFTAEAAAFRQQHHGAGSLTTGFLAAVDGATPPQDGLVRLGADGRAAVVYALPDFALPEPDFGALAASRRCRIVLATPGIFKRGWLPEGVEEQKGEFLFDLHGVRGRLAAAAVPRAGVVSGWDLARERPKPARRAVPAGAVYWLDQLEATPEALRELAARGLWGEPCGDPQRRAEGFNRIWIAPWCANEGA
ncbi:MAG: type III-B CRISPR module-associated Cmr3 family protein [Bryobacteraceae bacterium]